MSNWTIKWEEWGRECWPNVAQIEENVRSNWRDELKDGNFGKGIAVKNGAHLLFGFVSDGIIDEVTHCIVRRFDHYDTGWKTEPPAMPLEQSHFMTSLDIILNSKGFDTNIIGDMSYISSGDSCVVGVRSVHGTMWFDGLISKVGLVEYHNDAKYESCTKCGFKYPYGSNEELCTECRLWKSMT